MDILRALPWRAPHVRSGAMVARKMAVFRSIGDHSLTERRLGVDLDAAELDVPERLGHDARQTS
jgi:hypothetical protein